MRIVVAAYVAVLGALAAFAVIGGAVVLDATGPSGPLESAADAHSFNLVAWELRHFPEKWLYKLGDVFRGSEDSSDEAAIKRYFTLTKEMSGLRERDPNSSQLAADEEERAALENRVESIIEGRLTSILESQGLTMGPAPFTDLSLVFPPVDFEFDQPPRVLVTSPRDHIELTHDDLLSPGIPPDEITQIEADAETEPNTSALVVQSGGVATYPSVEDNLDSYDHLIEIVSHEWTHQYLNFYPLGSQYFSSSELRTINETTASISGQELAKLYFDKYGHLDLNEATPSPAASSSPSPSPLPAASAAPSEQPFDFTESMRDLRRQVEALLSQGKIDEAETLMSQKRDEFATKGYFIRKLNQAYFAFHGFYGTGSGSIDPIGPKVQQVFADAGSPGEFLRQMRSVTSQAEIDALLVR